MVRVGAELGDGGGGGAGAGGGGGGGGGGGNFIPDIINVSTLMEFMCTRIGRAIQINVTVLVEDKNKRATKQKPCNLTFCPPPS